MSWGMVAGAVISVVGGAVNNNKAKKDAAKQAASGNAAGDQQADIARDQWATYKDTYQPLEKAYVADAQGFDSPANQELAAGEASATVAAQYGKARDRLTRTPGLDPSSAAYTTSMAGLDMNQAAADAVGQNAARNRIKDMGWARRTDALSLGKGLPAQASAGLSSVAARNAAASQSAYANGLAQSNQNSAAIGQLVSRGINAWQGSGNGSGTTQPMGDLGYYSQGSSATGGGIDMKGWGGPGE